MAKEQNLSLNPAKISGTCGRLMCCLKYEESTYEELNQRNAQRRRIWCRRPAALGEVLHVNVLRQLIKVGITQEKGDVLIDEFPLEELKIVKRRRSHKGNQEYIDQEEQKQLRELEKEK